MAKRRHTGYRKKTKKPKPQEPNEITEMWREVRQDVQERRRQRLPARQDEIAALAKIGYRVRALTEYQFRVDDRLDLFPTRRRYHDIKTQARGSYRDPLAICRAVLGTPGFIWGFDMGKGESVDVWSVRCNVCEKTLITGTGKPPDNLVVGDSSTEVGKAIEAHMCEGTAASKHEHDFQTVVKFRATEN